MKHTDLVNVFQGCGPIKPAPPEDITAGEGGIPGNNDSGGLSSLYIWNALGIFPVSGQDLMLIGTPCFEKAVLHLPDGKDFVILRKGEGIYVKKARLDGEPLKELRFTVRRMMQDGTLEISMTERSEENG
ncbi:MAG: glycoside hydrolase family 92 protein [Oscillospiraceae bacterium]|nr:glycoside hydrolase family 92 protein [Oscillospiraceae bacterium]